MTTLAIALLILITLTYGLAIGLSIAEAEEAFQDKLREAGQHDDNRV